MKKVPKWLMVFAEWFLKLEGSWHFVGSTISVVLLVHRHEFSFASWFSPITDYIAGAGTLFCGWLIGEKLDEKG